MKPRVIYFDILNILACFSVLLLHHNGIVHYYDVNSLAWKQSLAFEVLFYWAVPVFFMLTGATLLDYRDKYTTKQFFYKRLLRSIFPFLLWSIILLIHTWFMDEVFPYKNIKEIFDAIIFTKLPYGEVYWFFIPLISLYCLIPVLSLIKDNKNILWYIVIFMFITHSVLPVLFNIIGIGYNYSLLFPMDGYVIFIVLGYLFSRIEFSKKQRIVIYILGGGMLLFRYFITYYYSLQDGQVNRILFSYTQFHSVILALAVFVLIKYMVSNFEEFFYKNNRMFGLLSSCSLGIYLIHKLVMNYELLVLNIKPDNVYWRFLGAFLTYIICFLIVFCIKKIPYLRRIFP